MENLTPALSLLFICKAIYAEASPVFYAANIFYICHATFSCLPVFLSPSLLPHTRQLSIQWVIIGVHPDPKEAVLSKAHVLEINLEKLEFLSQFPKLRTLQLTPYTDNSDDHKVFVRRYKKKGVMRRYLEHTGLDAIFNLPAIQDVSFYHEYPLGYNHPNTSANQLRHLVALEKYMTKRIARRK